MRPLRGEQSGDGSLLFGAHIARPGHTVAPAAVPVIQHQGAGWLSNPFVECADVLARVEDLSSEEEIFRLMVGRAEAAGTARLLAGAAEGWRLAPIRRELSDEDVSKLDALPRAFKLLFNYYFRDDLYGHWIGRDPIILSSGSFDERAFGLPGVLDECIRFALDRNWCGYSNSCGRDATREALAELEEVLCPAAGPASASEIAVTLGGTAAIGSLADFLAADRPRAKLSALCGVPNYAPLVAGVSRRYQVTLVETPVRGRVGDIAELCRRAHTADLILLQTVLNPWGVGVDVQQLRTLIDTAPADCTIVLDACHEHFGRPDAEPPSASAPLRGRAGAHVVFVRSLSKKWGAPGIKCGWIRASSDLIDGFYDHASTTYGGPPSIFALLLEVLARFESAQIGGASDYRGIQKKFASEYNLSLENLTRAIEDYAEDRRRFETDVSVSRAVCCERLAHAGIDYLAPEFSINVMCRHGQLPDYATFRSAIDGAGVSLFPSSLCMLPQPGAFRISPCIAEPVLDRAMTRLTRWSQTR